MVVQEISFKLMCDVLIFPIAHNTVVRSWFLSAYAAQNTALGVQVGKLVYSD